MRQLLILGFGYCAARFHRLYGHDYAAITATQRPDSRAAMPDGVAPLPFSGVADAAFRSAVGEATDILATAPPDAEGDPFSAAVQTALAAGGGGRSLIYLSTVGVYGDHGGDWVDETTPSAPLSERGRRRVAAEQAWRALAERHGRPLSILRLPGIYGRGRSVLDDLVAGTARRLVKPGQVFNRVHVDDIAAAIRLAFRTRQNRAFNIVDDEPAPPQDVTLFGARLLGLAPPIEVPFDQAALSPMAKSFYDENKRVSNRLAKQVLGWAPLYPSYREGLAAIAAERPR